MENGLPSNFLVNLSDNQVNMLYKRYITEQPTQPANTTKQTKTIDTYTVKPGTKTSINGVEVDTTGGTTKITPMEEDEDIDIVNDPDATADGMGMFESKKKGSKYNPWAICTSQMGKEFKTTERSEWSPKQKKKYERCVMDVKKSLKEGKNPYQGLLESSIFEMVKKHALPTMTKQDLINTVRENIQMVGSRKLDKPLKKVYSSKKIESMEAAEPKTKPGTKEPTTKPGTKPRISPHNPPKELPKEKPRAEKYKELLKKIESMEAAEPKTKPGTKEPTTKPGTKPKPRISPHNPPKELPKEKPRAEKYKELFIQALNQITDK